MILRRCIGVLVPCTLLLTAPGRGDEPLLRGAGMPGVPRAQVVALKRIEIEQALAGARLRIAAARRDTARRARRTRHAFSPVQARGARARRLDESLETPVPQD